MWGASLVRGTDKLPSSLPASESLIRIWKHSEPWLHLSSGKDTFSKEPKYTGDPWKRSEWPRLHQVVSVRKLTGAPRMVADVLALLLVTPRLSVISSSPQTTRCGIRRPFPLRPCPPVSAPTISKRPCSRTDPESPQHQDVCDSPLPREVVTRAKSRTHVSSWLAFQKISETCDLQENNFVSL